MSTSSTHEKGKKIVGKQRERKEERERERERERNTVRKDKMRERRV